MALLEIARDQKVQIPAIQLSDGQKFHGRIKTVDTETLTIELDEDVQAQLPETMNKSAVLTWQAKGIQRACPLIVRTQSPRVLLAQVLGQERRDSPRVRAEMQVVYKIVPTERVEEVAEEVMARVNTLSGPASETIQLLRTEEDPLVVMREEISALRDMIGDLMEKVDDLTAFIVSGAPQEPAKVRQPLALQNCSSTGLGMIAKERLELGQHLHLRITLRTVPTTIIDCMGVVMRCETCSQSTSETGSPTHDIGLRFTHIHESDRERLIHYLFKIQRRILRDLKEAREANEQGA